MVVGSRVFKDNLSVPKTLSQVSLSPNLSLYRLSGVQCITAPSTSRPP